MRADALLRTHDASPSKMAVQRQRPFFPRPPRWRACAAASTSPAGHQRTALHGGGRL